MPVPICFRLLMQLIERPFSLAFARAGNKSPARMPMMPMTTRSSIRVKALTAGFFKEREPSAWHGDKVLKTRLVFISKFIILKTVFLWETGAFRDKHKKDSSWFYWSEGLGSHPWRKSCPLNHPQTHFASVANFTKVVLSISGFY